MKPYKPGKTWGMYNWKKCEICQSRAVQVRKKMELCLLNCNHLRPLLFSSPIHFELCLAWIEQGFSPIGWGDIRPSQTDWGKAWEASSFEQIMLRQLGERICCLKASARSRKSISTLFPCMWTTFSVEIQMTQIVLQFFHLHFLRGPGQILCLL